MRLVPIRSELTRILNVTTKATSWTVSIPEGMLEKPIKRPVGSEPIYWLYIACGNQNAIVAADTIFQYDDGEDSYDIVTLEELIDAGRAYMVDSDYGALVAIPESYLTNKLVVDFGEGEATGSVWLLKKVPAMEGYSPESFGHYYVSRQLDTYQLAPNTPMKISAPAAVGTEEPVYLYVSGAVNLDIQTHDGLEISYTVTAGLYLDIPYVAAPAGFAKLLKYAKSFTLSATNATTVRIDFPVLSN